MINFRAWLQWKLKQRSEQSRRGRETALAVTAKEKWQARKARAAALAAEDKLISRRRYSDLTAAAFRETAATLERYPQRLATILADLAMEELGTAVSAGRATSLREAIIVTYRARLMLAVNRDLSDLSDRIEQLGVSGCRDAGRTSMSERAPSSAGKSPAPSGRAPSRAARSGRKRTSASPSTKGHGTLARST